MRTRFACTTGVRTPDFLYASFLWRTAIMTLLLCSVAQAVDLELGMGKTARTLNYAYSIGVTGKCAEHWRCRFGYANLGAPRINLLASDDSAADDIAAGKGTEPYYWIQPRDTKELYATVAREVEVGLLTYSIGAGIAAYHPMQQEDRHAGDNSMPVLRGNRTNFTPVLELGVGYGRTTLVFSHQTITEYGDWEDDTPKSSTDTISLRWRF